MRVLAKFEGNAYFLLRIVFGFLFSCHGFQKIFGMLGGHAVRAFAWPDWWAGIVELVAGVLIVLGLFTRIAGLLASGEMAFAYFMVHAKGSFFPIVNKGELAVIYCFVALFIACRGAGRFGIDRS